MHCFTQYILKTEANEIYWFMFTEGPIQGLLQEIICCRSCRGKPHFFLLFERSLFIAFMSLYNHKKCLVLLKYSKQNPKFSHLSPKLSNCHPLYFLIILHGWRCCSYRWPCDNGFTAFYLRVAQMIFEFTKWTVQNLKCSGFFCACQITQLVICKLLVICGMKYY